MNDDSELEPGLNTNAGGDDQPSSTPSTSPKSSAPIDHNDAVRAQYKSSIELGEMAESAASDDTAMVLPSFVPFVLKDRLSDNEAAILEAFRFHGRRQ